MDRSVVPRRAGPEVVVLASGGLDSCALMGHLARGGARVHPLFVKSGLVWEGPELRFLRRFLEGLPSGIAGNIRPLSVVSLPMVDLYGEHWSTTGRGVPAWDDPDDSVYLPGRNIVLLSEAAVHAAMLGVGRVAFGVLKGNPFPDAGPAFLRALEKSLSKGLAFPITFEAPFSSLTKVEVIRQSADLPLDLTFSCSNPKSGEPCAACAKCRERTLSLRAAGHPADKARPIREESLR